MNNYEKRPSDINISIITMIASVQTFIRYKKNERQRMNES